MKGALEDDHPMMKKKKPLLTYNKSSPTKDIASSKSSMLNGDGNSDDGHSHKQSVDKVAASFEDVSRAMQINQCETGLPGGNNDGIVAVVPLKKHLDPTKAVAVAADDPAAPATSTSVGCNDVPKEAPFRQTVVGQAGEVAASKKGKSSFHLSKRSKGSDDFTLKMNAASKDQRDLVPKKATMVVVASFVMMKEVMIGLQP